MLVLVLVLVLALALVLVLVLVLLFLLLATSEGRHGMLIYLRREGLILAMISMVFLGLQGVDRPDELPECAESRLQIHIN